MLGSRYGSAAATVATVVDKNLYKGLQPKFEVSAKFSPKRHTLQKNTLSYHSRVLYSLIPTFVMHFGHWLSRRRRFTRHTPRAAFFWRLGSDLQEGALYRRNFDSLILKCVDDDEATYCMREVLEGICGDHMAGRALANKILRQG